MVRLIELAGERKVSGTQLGDDALLARRLTGVPWDSMLIDDRIPPFLPPPDERPVWEPDPRTSAWVAATLALGAGGLLTAGFLSFVLLCAALACGAHAITRALPYGEGLREHRQ